MVYHPLPGKRKNENTVTTNATTHPNVPPLALPPLRLPLSSNKKAPRENSSSQLALLRIQIGPQGRGERADLCLASLLLLLLVVVMLFFALLIEHQVERRQYGTIEYGSTEVLRVRERRTIGGM
jgi:hypothetical protein